METDHQQLNNPRPLPIPAALLMELDRTQASAQRYHQLDERYRTALGYEFSWGQIVESSKPATGDLTETCEWQFVPTLSLARFHRAGGSLVDVAGLCVQLLCQISEAAGNALLPETRRIVWPHGLAFTESSDSFAAFSVQAVGRESIDKARCWLEECFLPAVMPRILDCLSQAALAADHRR